MKIHVAPKESAYKVFTLFVDDEAWRDIHASIFGQRAKFEALTSFEDFEVSFHALEYQRAKLYTIRRLSMKNQNSAELREALSSRLVSLLNTDRILQVFTDQGYINDEEWTKSFIRQQVARKIAPKVIYMKLKAKGIPNHLAQQMMNQSENSPQELIKQLLLSRYKNRNLKDYHEKQKVIGSLARKGFDLSDILETLRLLREG